MNKDEPYYLRAARINLKDLAATRARAEWKDKLADADALAARVLIQELINYGDEVVLASVAKYLGFKGKLYIKEEHLPENESIYMPDHHVAIIGDGQVVYIKVEKI